MNPPKRELNDRRTTISETFLEFAEPMLLALGPSATDAELERPLKVAYLVWNAVVTADSLGEKRFLEEIRKTLFPIPELPSIVNQLITRKRRLFRDDDRLIGAFKLTRRNGQLSISAEGREPARRAVVAGPPVDPVPPVDPAPSVATPAKVDRELTGGRQDKAWSRDSTGAIVNDRPHVGRNDPCPCGSGRKYKKCCLVQ